jgi:hypothetical protein
MWALWFRIPRYPYEWGSDGEVAYSKVSSKPRKLIRLDVLLIS